MSRAPSPIGWMPSGRPASIRRGPEALGPAGGDVELEAVLAGVAGARDDGGHARHRPADEVVVRDAGHVAIGQAAHQRLRLRPLHREQRGLVAHVLPLRAADAVRGDPRPVLVDVGGVDHEHVVVVGQPVHRQVVHDAAFRVAEGRVLDLADLEGPRVVGAQALDRGERVGAAHLELAHVADVEEADRAAHRAVLLDDPAVLHRHVPAAEGNHLRARLDVNVAERGALERGRRGGVRHLVARGALILMDGLRRRNDPVAAALHAGDPRALEAESSRGRSARGRRFPPRPRPR